MKQRFEIEMRTKKHLIDKGSAAQVDIVEKQAIIDLSK